MTYTAHTPRRAFLAYQIMDRYGSDGHGPDAETLDRTAKPGSAAVRHSHIFVRTTPRPNGKGRVLRA